jgi:hypothetical protein
MASVTCGVVAAEASQARGRMKKNEESRGRLFSPDSPLQATRWSAGGVVT